MWGVWPQVPIADYKGHTARDGTAHKTNTTTEKHCPYTTDSTNDDRPLQILFVEAACDLSRPYKRFCKGG
jgi:hypothetical protein